MVYGSVGKSSRQLEEEYISFKAASSEIGDHVTGHNGAENEDGTETWMEDAEEGEPSVTEIVS